jgi:hypothetical protein
MLSRSDGIRLLGSQEIVKNDEMQGIQKILLYAYQLALELDMVDILLWVSLCDQILNMHKQLGHWPLSGMTTSHELKGFLPHTKTTGTYV